METTDRDEQYRLLVRLVAKSNNRTSPHVVNEQFAKTVSGKLANESHDFFVLRCLQLLSSSVKTVGVAGITQHEKLLLENSFPAPLNNPEVSHHGSALQLVQTLMLIKQRGKS